jgi:Ca-activated chloride channel family protein
MAYGHPSAVRSHRRGGPKRRLIVAPWIVFSTIGVVILAGLSVGYVYLVRSTCSGQLKATIVASPSMQPVLDGLARRWQDTEPAVKDKCAAVEIEGKDAALMAQTLGASQEWDAKSGPAPDVWVPDSSAWVRRASTAAIAERMVPDLQPSVARTPAVIAMPKPMAEALGWPKTQFTWQDMISKFASSPEGWKAFGKDWGPFKFGMTDPLKSTAGLLALMAVLDGDDDGEVTPEEQNAVLKLKQVRTVYTEGTDQIFTELTKKDAESQDAALQYLSAFPALEQDVLTYNENNPKVPLVAIYPTNGSGDADYPYLALDASWANKDRQAVAKAFLTYLRGPEGRKAFLGQGFRDPNRAPGKGLTEINGFAAKLTTLPRAVLLADSVKQSMDTWTALTRPTNVLLVLDVSGSMKEQVPGAGRDRLSLAKEAAKNSVSLFSEDTRAGLWAFSTRQEGNADYRTVVPIGTLEQGRRAQLLSSIDKLTAAGNTGLYDTLAAAQQTVRSTFVEGSTNLVVLMTDGKNEDDTGGLNIDQLKEKLTQVNADAKHKVPVVTVAYGDDADFQTLQDISRTSGGQSYSSKTAFDINQVLLTAIFGRV